MICLPRLMFSYQFIDIGLVYYEDFAKRNLQHRAVLCIYGLFRLFSTSDVNITSLMYEFYARNKLDYLILLNLFPTLLQTC
jgi:hypothetical protein